MDWFQTYFALGLDLGNTVATLFAIWSQIGMIRSTHAEKVDYVLERLNHLGISIAPSSDGDVLVYHVSLGNECGMLFVSDPSQITFSVENWYTYFRIQDNCLWNYKIQYTLVQETPWTDQLLIAFADLIKAHLSCFFRFGQQWIGGRLISPWPWTAPGES
jgi:hypothetical protein